jgi:hypothetical protein
MLGDASQDVSEPGLRIDVIHLGGDDQAVKDRRALTATIGSAEQPGLAAQGHAPQRALGGVVAEPDATIVEEADEGRPSAQHVVDGLGQVAGARELVSRLVQPGLQLGDQWLAARLPNRLPLGGGKAQDLTLDGEDGVDANHGLQGQGIDRLRLLPTRLAVCGGLDIGQLEELAAKGEAPCRRSDRIWPTADCPLPCGLGRKQTSDREVAIDILAQHLGMGPPQPDQEV